MVLKFLCMLALISQANAFELNILSWNVFMLPKPVKFSMQEVRAQVIVKELQKSNYDIMFFQEAFDGNFRMEMTKLKKKYPHMEYLDRNGSMLYVLGSGLFVVSKSPFKVLDRIYYYACEGADCLARKGSILVEVTFPNGKRVQFATTHLQANDNYSEIRRIQLASMKNMFVKHKKDSIPQFLIGDVNINFGTSEFDHAIELMNMDYLPLSGDVRYTSSRINDCYNVPGDDEEWIDHVWFDKDSHLITADLHVKDFSFTHQGKNCPASDHHAVEATLKF